VKFVIFEMWELERPTNVPKWIPWKSWCTKVLSSVGFAPRHSYMAWWGVLWKIEIRDFGDVRVGKAYKCPQMSTMKFLVHEIFEFCGFCTGPSWSVHHGIARWLGGEFCEKMKFVIFEMWGLERPRNVPKWIPWKCWCAKVLSSVGFAHGQRWRCTTAYLDGLVGSFVKKWKSWFFRCEGWKGLQMSQMSTMNVLVHESFEFGGYCTGPSWLVHHGRARWLGGELCEKLKFVVFEMWGLERPTNVS